MITRRDIDAIVEAVIKKNVDQSEQKIGLMLCMIYQTLL